MFSFPLLFYFFVRLVVVFFSLIIGFSAFIYDVFSVYFLLVVQLLRAATS